VYQLWTGGGFAAPIDLTPSTGGITQADADARYYLNTTTLNNLLAPNGSLSMNSYKITNLADPIIGTDAVNL
jgi:hypothetical protein